MAAALASEIKRKQYEAEQPYRFKQKINNIDTNHQYITNLMEKDGKIKNKLKVSENQRKKVNEFYFSYYDKEGTIKKKRFAGVAKEILYNPIEQNSKNKIDRDRTPVREIFSRIAEEDERNSSEKKMMKSVSLADFTRGQSEFSLPQINSISSARLLHSISPLKNGHSR